MIVLDALSARGKGPFISLHLPKCYAFDFSGADIGEAGARIVSFFAN